ncbi:helix-turn-helix domain-containing protein [Pigmentiphaga litoralis]|uniref:AraC family transcriptional regulator n=1 Tax=Pigmentiphaga litoralis TaxID=516702 RepID=UPI003B43A774
MVARDPAHRAGDAGLGKTIAFVTRVDEGISLAVLRGRPDAELTVPAPGTQVFAIQVLLTGTPRFESDRGTVCRPRAGSLVLSQYSDVLGAQVHLPARRDVHIVDLRLSADALRRLTSFPVTDRLMARFGSDAPSHPHAALVVSCQASHAMLQLAYSLSSTPLADPDALALWRRARAYELLAHVIDLLATPVFSPALTAIENERLLRAFAVLEERFNEAWPALRLARAVGLPEKKLQSGFRARVGTSVHAHLRALRLRHAAQRLASGASVTDVAFDVGYDNLSHFGKAFRAHFGVLPSDYRSQRGAPH